VFDNSEARGWRQSTRLVPSERELGSETLKRMNHAPRRGLFHVLTWLALPEHCYTLSAAMAYVNQYKGLVILLSLLTFAGKEVL
jgi:hypothetical protein